MEAVPGHLERPFLNAQSYAYFPILSFMDSGFAERKKSRILGVDEFLIPSWKGASKQFSRAGGYHYLSRFVFAVQYTSALERKSTATFMPIFSLRACW